MTRVRDGRQKTPYRFTGQRVEGTLDLYYYNARWYDPVIGRFLQADTIVPEPGNPQALNRYAYTLNNPIKYIDPTGHANEESGGVAGGNPPHFDLSEELWQAIEWWARYFDLSPAYLAAVVAAEIMYDTDWYDAPMDLAIGYLAGLGLASQTSPAAFGKLGWAEAFLEYSQGGLPFPGGITFGPGIAQVHAATAMRAEQHFGGAFPVQPESASMRHLLLVMPQTNIMYAAGVVAMYADMRLTSGYGGDMSPAEMGAVFTAYHESLQTAFGPGESYESGAPPRHQLYVNQVLPLVWYYNFCRLYGR